MALAPLLWSMCASFYFYMGRGRTGCLPKSHLMGVPLAASMSYYSAAVNSCWLDLPIQFTHKQVWETPPYPKTYCLHTWRGFYMTHSFYTILAQIKHFCGSCAFSTCPERSMSCKSCCFLWRGTGTRWQVKAQVGPGSKGELDSRSGQCSVHPYLLGVFLDCAISEASGDTCAGSCIQGCYLEPSTLPGIQAWSRCNDSLYPFSQHSIY